MKAVDIQEMKEFRLSESAAPWITDLTDEHMGSIILWVRTLLLVNPIFGYQVLDDTILEDIEMDHNYAEKQA
eukprot:3666765-Heterocapsa_arctica.AAC.1